MLNTRYAMKEARKVANDYPVRIALHHGTTKQDVGIRITCCDIETAREYAQALADKLYPHGVPVISAGFGCVWLR